MKSKLLRFNTKEDADKFIRDMKDAGLSKYVIGGGEINETEYILSLDIPDQDMVLIKQMYQDAEEFEDIQFEPTR